MLLKRISYQIVMDSTRTASQKVLSIAIASFAVAVALYNVRHSENYRTVFPYIRTATETIGCILPDAVRHSGRDHAIDLGEEAAKALNPDIRRIAVVQLAEPVVILRSNATRGVQLAKGTRLDVVGSDGRNLRVRYGAEIVNIPRTSTAQGSGAVANMSAKKK